MKGFKCVTSVKCILGLVNIIIIIMYFFLQSILDMFNEGRNAEIQSLTDQIEELKKIEYMSTVRKDVIEIYRVRSALGF